MFKALQVRKESEGNDGYRCALAELDDADLPGHGDEGDVTVRVAYSTLNYKDALAITGRAPVIRKFPLVPGIDCAGAVESSAHPAFKAGDQVVLNGWGVGEAHNGGLAQKARLKGDWLIPLPGALTPRQAMAIGTAGYTAMLCVQALERHGVVPANGEVLVTGASGGVGSVAIALLAKRGFRVVASTGKAGEAAYLNDLGAAEVIDRAQLSAPGKPLARERWAGVVDAVGSHTLANACASTKYGGAVAACGLAGGMDFPASVAPFILRGVTLYGVDSVMAPRAKRIAAWDALADTLDRDKLDAITREIPLGDAVAAAADILAGKVRGRLVVDVNALTGMAQAIRFVELPSGARMPVLGQGTWKMGEQRSEREREIAALRLGLDLGLTLVDTAEMYGEGGAEEIVGAAIEGRRDEVFIVSKVYPHNASLKGAVAACERSLKRMRIDRIDLYLLHWRGSHPLADTVRAFEQLRAAGKIGDWGVSNLDKGNLVELSAARNGEHCAANQVLYNLAHRGIEWDALPWCRERRIPVMAYCPVDQGGRMLRSAALKGVAARHAATPAQVALAWLVRQDGVVAIPKAVGEAHVRANRAALDVVLSQGDLAELDRAFPPPSRKAPLAMT